MTEFFTEQPADDGDGMIELLIEQPIVSEDGPRRDFARQVAKWIRTQPIAYQAIAGQPTAAKRARDPKVAQTASRQATADHPTAANRSSPVPRGHVAGIYGSRGSGKTSFLFTLLEELRACGGSAMVLPTAKEESLPRAIFKPSETRAKDGLLLMLLEHLNEQYPQRPDVDADHSKRIMKRIQETEVLTKETAPFLEYAKEVSPSDERLVHRYVEVLTKAATTTVSLRSDFSELLRLRASEQERLVLFIDDVDLQPHRALELLELVYLFLDRPGIFVVLAADKPLLLQAVDGELRRRRMHRPGLGAALFAKYVPYSWPLPVPSEAERLDMLSLFPSWLDDATKKILAIEKYEHDVRQRRSAGGRSHPEPREKAWPPDDPEVISEMQAARWFLPEAYRDIKAVRNALQIIEKSSPSRGEGHLGDVVAGKYPGLGLRREVAPLFVLLLIMFDRRWPELQVAFHFERSASDFVAMLEDLYRSGKSPAAKLKACKNALRALGVSEHVFVGDDVLHALFRLGEVLYSWSRLNAEAAVVELALVITFSGNTDAPSRFRELWLGTLTDRQVHLDLRRFAPSGKPDSGEQVGRAVAHAMEKLPELIGTTGRLWLGAEAPSSFLAWLGFWLDYRRPVVAVNAKTLVSVEVAGRLDPPDRGQIYALCVREWVREASGSKDACVIFDFFGRSVPDDAPKLAAASGASEAALCCRLLYSGGSDFNFGDVEAILLDVLELLTELRQRGVSTLHVGMVMPDVVAFALGRQLKSRGLAIVLYEFIGARYERAIALEE